MTAEDQDAVVGRLVRERRDLRAHSEALIAKAAKIGDLLGSVGQALRMRPSAQRSLPDVILRINDDGSVTVSSQYRPQEMLTGQFPSVADIRQLLLETTDINGRLSELDTHLKAFGV